MYDIVFYEYKYQAMLPPLCCSVGLMLRNPCPIFSQFGYYQINDYVPNYVEFKLLHFLIVNKLAFGRELYRWSWSWFSLTLYGLDANNENDILVFCSFDYYVLYWF